MRNLSNQPCDRLSIAQLSDDVDRTGYEILVDGEIIALHPNYDAAGLPANVGDIVEVSSLGIGRQALVTRRLSGYSYHWEDRRMVNDRGVVITRGR